MGPDGSYFWHNANMGQLEDLIVNHFRTSSLLLSSACYYPSDYFDQIAAPSDENLEIERNDVRDVLRAVTGSGEKGSTSNVVTSRSPLGVSCKILSAVVQSCFMSLEEALTCNQPYPETCVHAFSALAKPLNSLSKHVISHGDTTNMAADILNLALRCVRTVCHSTINAFQSLSSMSELLPRSRTTNLALASLSPMLSNCCQGNLGGFDPSIIRLVYETSVLSLERIPELVAESTLGRTQFEIRGAMRGPGGEDHVGCLTLMRLMREGPDLTRLVVETSHIYVERLCALYTALKKTEMKRPIGVIHGEGVAPVSRRILLGFLCGLQASTEQNGELAKQLERLFHSTLEITLSQRPRPKELMYVVAEGVFDLSYFHPDFLRWLFAVDNANEVAVSAVERITTLCIQGYEHVVDHTAQETIIQWNRLRAAMFQVLMSLANNGLPERALKICVALAHAECQASKRQCDFGLETASALFNDDVISLECVPSGLFVRAIGVSALSDSDSVNVEALTAIHQIVRDNISHPCPDPIDFADPRPITAEAWFICMADLSCHRGLTTSAQTAVLVDSAATGISMLFSPSLGTTKGLGMSLDGPHSLALTRFLASFFSLGFPALQSLSNVLSSTSIETSGAISAGLVVIGSALLRAVYGALPPWAAETIPDVYCSLFGAMGKDPDSFGIWFRHSIDGRLSPSAPSFGAVSPGEYLAGKTIGNMGAHVQNNLIEQVVTLARKDDKASWKRLKVVIQQACGGKNKGNEFRQKPSPTRWDFLRV